MNNKIIIINGPNLNLLGEREQSQYGSTTFDQLKENCSKKGQEIGTLEIVSNDAVVLTSELVALDDIEAKGFFGRLWSRFVLWLYGLFGAA